MLSPVLGGTIAILVNQPASTDSQIELVHQISAYLKTGAPNTVPREVAAVAHYIAVHYKRPDPVQLVETNRTTCRFQLIESLQYPSNWVVDASTF